MQTESLIVAVVVQRREIASRWQTHQWQTLAVLADRPYPFTKPVCVSTPPENTRWCHTGLEVRLHSEESEGYFLNCSAPTPCWFVMSRLEPIGAEEVMTPRSVTLSYNEAARLMDGGEQVDTVALPAEIVERLQAFVDAYYRPVEKRKRKKPSFEGGAGVALMATAEASHGSK